METKTENSAQENVLEQAVMDYKMSMKILEQLFCNLTPKQQKKMSCIVAKKCGLSSCSIFVDFSAEKRENVDGGELHGKNYTRDKAENTEI